MSEKTNKAAFVEALTKKLKTIRVRGYRKDPSETEPLLYILGYDGDRTPDQVEALLIKFVENKIPDQSDRDILLMSFRLLRGYEGDDLIELGARRRRYVLNSGYMKPKESELYGTCEDEAERGKMLDKGPCERLRKYEDKPLIPKLAKAISRIENLPAYIEDVDKYLVKKRSTDGKSVVYRAKLPLPSYLNAHEDAALSPSASMTLDPDAPNNEDGAESTIMMRADGDAIAERITGSMKDGNSEIIESLGKRIGQIGEMLSANNEDRSKESLGIIEMIGAQSESLGNKIIEELRNSNKGQDTSQAAGDFPLFIASSFWFSHISSKSERNQVLYRNGYGDNDAVILLGNMGDGQFSVISSEYVFMETTSNSSRDVPQAQNNMLYGLLSDLGAGFPKKRIGLSYGHNERVGVGNFNSNLRQKFSLSGVAVTACSAGQLRDCDILIVGTPLQPFSADEQEMLEAFVYDGGSVVFCGCGSYWATLTDENGQKRKIEDYPINLLGKAFRFSIEAKSVSKYMEYGAKIRKALIFTPVFHVSGAHLSAEDNQVSTLIDNAFMSNSDAQRALAERYQYGGGLPQNYDYSLYWYKMSAFAGNAISQYYLGCCYNDSFANGIYKNTYLYQVWLTISAQNGELRAISTLGLDMYYGYNGMTKNKTGGQALIERAANQGRHNAQYHLGVIYMEQGKYKEAGEWLLKSCDSDNTGVRADARYQLAFLLKDGKGFAQDMTLACHNLLTSAKEGSKKAAAVINQPDNGFFDSGDQVFLDALAEVGYDMEQMLENILENSQG